ncbi:hypothetical protein PT2222_230039 [Paraburkholderia tropica]
MDADESSQPAPMRIGGKTETNGEVTPMQAPDENRNRTRQKKAADFHRRLTGDVKNNRESTIESTRRTHHGDAKLRQT